MSLAKGANKNVIKPVNNKQTQTDNKKGSCLSDLFRQKLSNHMCQRTLST